ncbi:hypothetical protein [Halorubrum amylolyticum]|uniref:hypothetical protein n=1 Tax=Halorubrum amylolyticum TaxID=2508724 RepID=UPI001008D8DA|nr:hypothetical protein [Halorubrum amylolyticum]
MKRRQFGPATVAILGLTGCLEQLPDASSQSDKDEFQNIPDSCSSEDLFLIDVNNNNDQPHQVTISLFNDEREMLYQEMSLTEDSRETTNDSEIIRSAGCYDKPYSVEVNVSERESVERDFNPKSGGFLSVIIKSDETDIIFSTAD